MAMAIPPYTSIFDYADEKLTIALNLGNYIFLAEDDMYVNAYISSVKIAFNATGALSADRIPYGLCHGSGTKTHADDIIIINTVAFMDIILNQNLRLDGAAEK